MWPAATPDCHPTVSWLPKQVAPIRVHVGCSRQLGHPRRPEVAFSGGRPRRGASCAGRAKRVARFGLITDSLTVIVGAAVVVSCGFMLWAIPALGSQDGTPPRSPSKEQGARQEDSTGQGETSAEDVEGSSQVPEELMDGLKQFDGNFLGPWQVLGFSEVEAATVTEEQIRNAYRQAARKEHPDRSSYPDAEERFQKVLQAYAILRDEPTRDALREALELDIGSLQELNEKQVENDEQSSGKLRILVVLVWLVFVAGAVQFLQNIRSEDLVPRQRGQYSMVIRLDDDGTYKPVGEASADSDALLRAPRP